MLWSNQTTTSRTNYSLFLMQLESLESNRLRSRIKLAECKSVQQEVSDQVIHVLKTGPKSRKQEQPWNGRMSAMLVQYVETFVVRKMLVDECGIRETIKANLATFMIQQQHWAGLYMIQKKEIKIFYRYLTQQPQLLVSVPTIFPTPKQIFKIIEVFSATRPPSSAHANDGSRPKANISTILHKIERKNKKIIEVQ